MEIFLKDFLRDVGGTLRREMSGEPGGTFGDVGGTLGEPPLMGAFETVASLDGSV